MSQVLEVAGCEVPWPILGRVNVARNVSDEMLSCRPGTAGSSVENAQKLFGKRATVVATAEDVTDQIDRAVKIAGIDHVEIGNDFDGIAVTANGLEDVSKRRALVRVLWKRGHAESDLKKILDENFLRVVREATGA